MTAKGQRSRCRVCDEVGHNRSRCGGGAGLVKCCRCRVALHHSLMAATSGGRYCKPCAKLLTAEWFQRSQRRRAGLGPPCACGCGQRCRLGNTWINGHNSPARGKRHALDRCARISAGLRRWNAMRRERCA